MSNGLSDIHLFTSWDLDGNPIKMGVSKTLKMSNKDLDKPCIIKPFSKPQCGDLETYFSKKQWEAIFGERDAFDSLLEKQRVKVGELLKEVDLYLENKCKEYCRVNRITLDIWQSFAVYECFKNKCEIRYKGELVCGAAIKSELNDNVTEASVSLELY